MNSVEKIIAAARRAGIQITGSDEEHLHQRYGADDLAEFAALAEAQGVVLVTD